MLSGLHWLGRARNLGLTLAYVVMLPLAAFAQGNTLSIGKVTLPSGHEITVISTSTQQGARPNEPAIARITLPASAAKTLTLQRVADDFFSYVWGPKVESLDARQARVHVAISGKASAAQTFSYVRKGDGLWLPDGRELPDWLKPGKSKKVPTSKGPALWIEAERQAFLTMAGRTVPQYDLRLEGGLVGLQRIVTAANAFLATRVNASAPQAPLVSLNLFGHPRSAGFHFRPLTRFWQVVPKTGKPWLLVKFQKSFVMASKAFVLIMTYVPEGPFTGIERPKLQAEAERLMAAFGRERAEKLDARFVSIIALWPSPAPRARAKGFSTVYERGADGTWKRSEK